MPPIFVLYISTAAGLGISTTHFSFLHQRLAVPIGLAPKNEETTWTAELSNHLVTFTFSLLVARENDPLGFFSEHLWALIYQKLLLICFHELCQ